jgi:hypothetical protein
MFPDWLLMMTGAAESRAESVSVQGANGTNFMYGNPNVPATNGESVTATAGSMQPVTDPYNSAYAVGGNGGQGVSDNIGESGGWGGNASATAATSVISGSAEADATAIGGAFVGGGYGIAGEAYAIANAAAAGGGNAVATAMATGGACLGACQNSNNGYATSNAETVNGAMADAQSSAISGANSFAEGQASSSAKTSFTGVSVQSSALATNFGTATTNATAQGGSGQSPPVNPELNGFAFSTALPNAAYATTLIGSASNVAEALLGPDDTIFGTTILGGSDSSSTFDFSFRSDLILGVIAGGYLDIVANGTDVLSEDVGDNTIINLGSIFGPNIDLTIEGDGVFAFGGAVPEPSTWAMMLVGFAALGYAGYRRAKEPRAA